MSKQQTWLKYLPIVGIVLMVVLVLVAGLWLQRWLGDQQPDTKKMVQQITVITPPPPPPPPPEQPPPPQEPELQEEVIEEQLEAAPNEEAAAEAAGDELGVDADGSAGGDGFGLVARKGGRGVLGGGGYEQFVRQQINAWIVEHPRLKHLGYVAVLTLRIAPDGSFEVVDLDVTGDAEVERLLRETLNRNGRLSRARPLEAAEVVKLRVRSVL